MKHLDVVVRVFASVLVVAAFLLAPAGVAAQDHPTYRLSTFHLKSADSDLHEKVTHAIRTAMAREGFAESGNSHLRLLVAATDVPEDRIAISVAVLEAIPDTVVAWGENAEVFYAGVSEKIASSMPEEGSWVRQYVSKEYMQQFSMPRDFVIRVAHVADLETEASAMVKRILQPPGDR